MTRQSEHGLRVRELFSRLTDLEPDDRAEVLAAEPVASVREEVRELLAFESEGAPPLGLGARAGLATPGAVLPQVDGYHIHSEIGDGSSGRVFSATHERDGAAVAIKILRHSIGTSNDHSRFALEVAILESLDHRGIARFHAATTAQTALGPVPALVMDLVAGLAITKHCDALDLDDPARVRLLAEVCDALQHAHERGIVHRDLKPANVLVDEAALPVVLDFGIASARGVEGLDALARTREGDLLGTLAYMSPEQARGQDVDAQSDVYSLGVILFELLTGQLPHSLAGSVLTDALRKIAEQDAAALTDARPEHAGDLATIVRRSLERERASRYPSAAAFAADLRRFLAKEAIHARPPGTLEQFARFARRNRQFVAACAAVFAALALGVAGLGYGIVEASAGERRAQALAAESREMLEGLLAFVEAPGLEARGYDVRVVEKLEEFSERTLATTDLGNKTALHLHHQLGVTWKDLGDDGRSVLHLERVLTLADASDEDQRLLAGVLLDLGNGYLRLGDLDDAGAALRDSRDLRVRQFGADSVEAALAESRLAYYERAASEFEAAESRAAHALERLQQSLGSDALDVQRARNVLAGVWIEQGDRQRAIDLLEQTAAVLERVPSAPVSLCETVRGNLALVLHQAGRPADAEALYRRALAQRIALYGEGHPAVAQCRRGLGTTLKQLQQFDEALQVLAQAAGGIEAHRGPMHRDTLGVQDALAQAMFLAGQRDEALALQQTVVQRWLERPSLRDNAAMGAFNTLAQFFHHQQRFQDAFLWIERAAEVARLLHPETDIMCLTVDSNAAQALMSIGRKEEGEARMRRVLGHMQALGDEHAVIRSGVTMNLGWHLAQTGRTDEGLPLLAAAEHDVCTSLRPGDLRRIRAQGHLAETLRILGRFDDARSVLDRMQQDLEVAAGRYARDAERFDRLVAAVEERSTTPLDERGGKM